jgi:hypothetical protein
MYVVEQAGWPAEPVWNFCGRENGKCLATVIEIKIIICN